MSVMGSAGSRVTGGSIRVSRDQRAVRVGHFLGTYFLLPNLGATVSADGR